MKKKDRDEQYRRELVAIGQLIVMLGDPRTIELVKTCSRVFKDALRESMLREDPFFMYRVRRVILQRPALPERCETSIAEFSIIWYKNKQLTPVTAKALQILLGEDNGNITE